MQIKRFTAPTMPQALRKIKAALGDDAVILATRKIKGDDGNLQLEVTAALDAEGPSQFKAPEEAPKIDVIADKTPEPVTTADSNLTQMLDKHGVLPDISRKIDAAVKAMATTGFTEFDTLDMVLGKMIPFSTPAQAIGRGKAHIFIGPTGAGKTTTMCKMAISKKMDGHSVGLITLDNQKIGAVEQLASYARAMSEEAFVMSSKEDWRNINLALGPRDYIFIDTPGINAFNKDQLVSLKKRLDVLGLDAQVHLVLPAALNPMEMAAMPPALALLHPETIIFTKFDETTYLGGLTNVAVTSGLKVCYITDGPKVPTDIVELNARTLAERLSKKPRLPWEKEE